jgi:hypothetical protein
LAEYKRKRKASYNKTSQEKKDEGGCEEDCQESYKEKKEEMNPAHNLWRG